MANFLCQIKNNADFPVRVVTISQFGQSDRIIQGLETIVTQFQAGRKVLIAWKADSGELLEHHVINVTQNSLFKVFKEAAKVITPPGGGAPTEIQVAIFPPLADDNGTSVSDVEDTGQPGG